MKRPSFLCSQAFFPCLQRDRGSVVAVAHAGKALLEFLDDLSSSAQWLFSFSPAAGKRSSTLFPAASSLLTHTHIPLRTKRQTKQRTEQNKQSHRHTHLISLFQLCTDQNCFSLNPFIHSSFFSIITYYKSYIVPEIFTIGIVYLSQNPHLHAENSL